MSTLATQMVLASAEMEPRLFDLDLQLLSDAVLMIIAVFALFLIASHFLFNPVRNMMQNRQDRIKRTRQCCCRYEAGACIEGRV